MKHFLKKSDDKHLCLFFFTKNITLSDLSFLLRNLDSGDYRYDSELPEYISSTGIIFTSFEGGGVNKSALTYPDNYEGYEYICIQFELKK